MPERVVVGLSLSPAAKQYLESRFPAGHELRIRSAQGVTDDDLAWATALCCFYVDAERIRVHPNVRWLHVPAVGIDRFIGLQTTRPDLRLTRHGPFNAPAVAEHGVALLFALRRGVPQMVLGKERREWARDAIVRLEPMLVSGGEAHVLGYGPVARTLIATLAALGMRVTAYRREASGQDPHVARFCALRDLAREIGGADAVFGMLPAVPETRALLNREVFAAMKSSALVINLGRSNLIDHAHLIEALVAGRIAGAALDVFDEEPLPANSPLWDAPSLIISPHVGGQFRGNFERGIDVFLAELEAYLKSQHALRV